METTSSSELNSIRERLVGAGVPPNVVEYTLRLRPIPWLSDVSLWLFIAFLIIGFTIGGFYLSPTLERMAEANALSHARSLGGIFYEQQFGLSLVVAFFAWFCMPGALCNALPRFSERVRASQFVRSFMARSWAARMSVRMTVALLSSEADPRTYLRRFVGWDNTAWPAAILATLSILAVTLDLQTHSVFTDAAYIRSPFLPWASTMPRLWSSAVNTELACIHGTGENDGIAYRINFSRGESVSVGDATPIGGSWLDHAETIDAQLRRFRVPRRRWTGNGDVRVEDPLHPTCLRAQYERLGDRDYARLQALLSVE